MGRHGGERRPRADGQARLRRAAHAGHLANAAQADQHGRLELAALHVRIEIGAARHEHRGRAVIGHELHRVAHRHGSQVGKLGQPHHVPKGLSVMFSAGCPNADSTALGSGNLNSGSLSGPTRGDLPWRPSSRALRTFSGRSASRRCARRPRRARRWSRRESRAGAAPAPPPWRRTVLRDRRSPREWCGSPVSPAWSGSCTRAWRAPCARPCGTPALPSGPRPVPCRWSLRPVLPRAAD